MDETQKRRGERQEAIRLTKLSDTEVLMLVQTFEALDDGKPKQDPRSIHQKSIMSALYELQVERSRRLTRANEYRALSSYSNSEDI